MLPWLAMSYDLINQEITVRGKLADRDFPLTGKARIYSSVITRFGFV